jgi:hypothetical protein
MHRVGSYGDPIYDAKGRVVVGYAKSARRCLSKAEMCAKNMAENEKGIWTTGAFDPNLVGTFAKRTSNEGEEHEEETVLHQGAAQDVEEGEKEQEFSSPRG